MRDGQIKELLSYKFSAAMKEYRESDKDFYINLGFVVHLNLHCRTKKGRNLICFVV